MHLTSQTHYPSSEPSTCLHDLAGSRPLIQQLEGLLGLVGLEHVRNERLQGDPPFRGQRHHCPLEASQGPAVVERRVQAILLCCLRRLQHPLRRQDARPRYTR